MQSKKDLLDLAMSMDTQWNYESFYRFAQNYVFHLSQQNAEDTSSFFDCVRYCGNNLNAAKTRMGISGNQTERLRRWSSYINGEKRLTNLSAFELNYVLACCARLCKAKQG